MLSALAGRAAGLLDWCGDHANPLLVRMVRQELRNRSFFAVFLLLMVVALVVSMFIAATADADSGSGAHLFGILCAALGFALVVAQPLGVYNAMVRERTDATWDLLDLTGIRPAMLLRGMLQAGLVQGALYLSAMAPFLIMAYLLRGIDLLSIVCALPLLVAAGLLASCLTIFAGCLPNRRGARNLLGIVVLLGLIALWVLSIPFWFAGFPEIMREFYRELSRNPAGVTTAIGFMVNLWLAAMAVLLVLSASQLTFRADNRVTGPRLLWFVLWINLLLWIAGLYLFTDMDHEDLAEILAAGALAGAVWAVLFAAFAVTEDYALSPRQARWIRQARGWRRWTSWFLGPGATRGRLATGLLVASVGAVAVVARLLDSSDDDVRELTLAAVYLLTYGLGLILVVDALCRGPLRRWCDQPVHRRTGLLPTMALGAVTASMPAVILDAPQLHLLNPLFPLFGAATLADHPSRYGLEPEVALLLSFFVLLLACGITLIFVVEGLGRLAITTVRVQAQDDDRNPRDGA